MGLCKKCNTVKSTQLFNEEQICDDCINNNNLNKDKIYEEQQKFTNNHEKKVEDDVSLLVGIFIAIIIIVFILFFIFSGDSEEEKQKKEVIKSEETLKNISKYDVYENYKAYKILSTYYKDNLDYKIKYEKYNQLEKLSADCFMKATSINREYTLNKNSYSVNSFGNNKTTMINDETISRRIEFSVKNDFGMEINYISEYECNLNGLIKQISMYRK